MYQQPYFIPGFYSNFAPSMMRGAAMNTAFRGLGAERGLGLFSRIGNGFQALKNINWSGIINNTSRTLGLVNQAIPVVKQVGPMMNNMKSMLKIASIFKDETDTPTFSKRKNYHFPNATTSPSSYSHNDDVHYSVNSSDIDDYSPTFFIPS